LVEAAHPLCALDEAEQTYNPTSIVQRFGALNGFSRRQANMDMPPWRVFGISGCRLYST
jgi:hypothetical protein